MFVLNVLLRLLQIYYWLIIIRVIVSFLPLDNLGDTGKKLLAMLYEVTEPILGTIRGFLPRNQMGLDFSPFLAILIIMLLQRFLIMLFRGF